MIESMVTATALNIGELLRGKAAQHEATWNAVCLADFGDSGVAFVAQPQIPAAQRELVRLRQVGAPCEDRIRDATSYRKMRRGESEPFYEKAALQMLGIGKLKRVT